MDKTEEAIIKAAVGGAIGVTAGLANTRPVHLHRAGLGAPVATFAQTTTHALKHGATVGSALGAGATAVVGGPAVVAAVTSAAVVAAPFVAAAAVAGAVGYGLYKLFSDD